LRRRPFPSLALGLALYTSLVSVCCGFGVIAAPWFACELLALLLGAGLDRSLLRTRSWFWAGLIQMFSVIVLSSVASLALMSFGVAGAVQTAPEVALPLQVGQGLLVAGCAGALVLSLTVYFEHAPSILIERGGGFTVALLESARIVSLHGAARTWITSALARGLPLVGAVLVLGLLALRASLSATVGFILLLLPVLVLLLLVGQGMLAASYLHVRAEVTDPAQVPAGGEPSKRGTAVWAVLLSCVALGPVLVSISLLKPSLPRRWTLSPTQSLVLEAEARDKPRSVYIPHTGLSLRLSHAQVRVLASDGGGAGTIPLPRGDVHSVRVAELPAPVAELRQPRGESTLAIAIRMQDGRQFTTWIDEAGVRLDDTWERRLSLRLSPWAAGLLVSWFAWTAVWIARSLPPQARIRRKLSRQHAPHPDVAHELRLRAALRARVIGAALWLLPPALGSIAIGLSALFG
jgi:hypothetical protein